MRETPPPFGIGDTSYRAAGGEDGLLQLCRRFYTLMGERADAAGIHAMHTRSTEESARRLSAFLCGWLGGPPRHRERYLPAGINIPRFHHQFEIGERERDAWLACMGEAVAEQSWDDRFKAYLMHQFSFPAEACRNR